MRSNYSRVVLFFLIFLLLSFFISNIIEIELLGIAMFIFGLFLAFALDNRKKRLEVIQQNLRLQDSKILSIYELSKIFGKKVSLKIKRKIEEFLITQLDYKLEDIDHSNKKLSELFYAVQEITPRTPKQIEFWRRMVERVLANRDLLKEVSYNVKSKMSYAEWTSLLLLFGVVTFLIYQENNLALFYSKVVISVLLTCFMFFIIILKDLDALNWQEKKWIWEPLIVLFRELDLQPYVPEDVLSQKRLILSDIKDIDTIRVGRFKHPYPNFKDKKIEIVRLK